MNALILNKFLKISLLTLLIPFSPLAFAEDCVDFKKEVSPDAGLTWYDANTESEAVTVTNEATYRFTVIKCGSLSVNNISVTDSLLGITAQPLEGFLADQWDGTQLAPLDGTERSFTISSNICEGQTGLIQNIATAYAEGAGTTAIGGVPSIYNLTDVAWVQCETTTSGGEGCTPGYWKQPHHFDSWPIAVYPDTLFSDIFARIISIRTRHGVIENPTLAQALTARGGQVNTAARHATAAYLNALSGDVNYDMTTNQVISAFQDSFDSMNFGDIIDALVSYNEQNCQLN